MQGMFNGTQFTNGSLSNVLSQMKQSGMKANGSHASSMQTRKVQKLNYNSKEISSQLLRARKAQNASTVLMRAKSKLNMLKNCEASGNFERQEVEIAIIHAKKVVRCAEMKLQNLKEEEQLKKRNEEVQEVKQQMQRLKELEAKRRRHREEENGKVQEAELEYQRQGGGVDMQQVGDSYVQDPLSAETGVVLELSAAASDISADVPADVPDMIE